MNDALSATKTVAVVLSLTEQPQVHAISDQLGSELVIGNEAFSDTGAGDWLGFYDWLRTRSGEVIGVRLWVDDVTPQIRAAAACSGVVAGESCSPFMIYLGHEHEFDAEQSDDQDFGSNMLLANSSKFAITFYAPSSR